MIFTFNKEEIKQRTNKVYQVTATHLSKNEHENHTYSPKNRLSIA